MQESSEISFQYSFRDFLESGDDDAASPFLKPSARKFAAWLELPLALVSFCLLLTAWIFSCCSLPTGAIKALVAATYFLSGMRATYHAAKDLLAFKINIDVLMTLAAYMCLITGSSLEGALLLVLFDISRNMEQLVSQKARKSLMSLRSLAPEKAAVLSQESVVSFDSPTFVKNVKDVLVGQTILIKAGEIAPLDGVVALGSSHVTTAHLTGEPQAIRVKEGDEIASGSQILESPILLRVSLPASEATLTRIIKLVMQAGESKPKLELLFDRISDNYAKSIIFSSALLALFLPLLFEMNYLGYEGSIYRSLSFMIAASPCALILAVPISYLSALSSCARKGIVLKSGSILDSLASCCQLAFDKTGTLTYGELTVHSKVGWGQGGKAEIKSSSSLSKFQQAALALERHSNHPLAKALVKHFETESISSSLEWKEIKQHLGSGLAAQIKIEDKWQEVRLGKGAWGLEIMRAAWKKEVESEIANLEKQGAPYALLSSSEQAIIFSFKDKLRLEAKEVALKLQSHLLLHMLTGDHKKSAVAIAEAVSIKSVFSDLKPEDKLAKVKDLREKGPLAMIGDGINDAPALAGATVGLAMASLGSAAATVAADILLLGDDLRVLPWLFQKAYQTRRVIWQNLVLASLAIIVASTSALLGWIPLWFAVIAHEGGTVLVGLNGLRLLYNRDLS